MTLAASPDRADKSHDKMLDASHEVDCQPCVRIGFCRFFDSDSVGLGNGVRDLSR